jgi:hypothetical protein
MKFMARLREAWRRAGEHADRARASTEVATRAKAPTVSKPGASTKEYSLGLVGESNYQDAIRRCREGEPVALVREPGNPYDAEAIAALGARGETIGYVPRDCWLREPLAEGKGCSATIRSIGTGGRGLRGVVLAVRLGGEPLGERDFRR